MNDLIEQATKLMTAEAMWEYRPVETLDPQAFDISAANSSQNGEDGAPLFI